MRVHPSIFGTVMAVLLALFLPTLCGAQEPQFVPPDRAIKMMVVSIASQRHDGKVKSGFGFVIGLVGGVPVIATANHVLRAPGSSYPPRSVTVRYVFVEGRAFEAKALSLFDGAADIGLIGAATPGGFDKLYQPEPADCSAKLRRSDKLWYVGRGGDWYIPAEPARLRGFAGDGRLLLENSDATEGSSGAPLVTSNGIVGMIVSGQGAGSATAVSIGAIRQLVDGKIFLKDGSPVDEEWIHKEASASDCENCKRWRAERPSEAHKICPDLKDSYCASLRIQGFPTHKTWHRVKFEMDRSCNCVPKESKFRANPPDRFRKFSRNERERLSCRAPALRELFGRTMLLGGRIAPIIEQFRPSVLDFRTIFYGSDAELAERHYAAAVKTATNRYMETGLEPSMVHLPRCLAWPAGLGRSFGRLKARPMESVIYCNVVFDNPVRRGKQVGWGGFFYVNGRWVWLYDVENWD